MIRQAFASVGFGLGFCSAWLVCATTRLPLLWYLPLEHRWAFGSDAPTLGMDFFGRLLVAVVAGTVAAAVGAGLATARRERWLEPAIVLLLAFVVLDLAVHRFR